MLALVKLDQSIGHFGKMIRVMAVRMHKELANGRWTTKLEELWIWCHLLYMRNIVDVVMGDFNMSLFNEIPELRNHRFDGVVVTLGRSTRAFVAYIHVYSFAFSKMLL